MGIEEYLGDIKSAGNCLAYLTQDHLSILYSMDKARTREELVRALEQASKRLVGLKKEEVANKIRPSSLERIIEIIYKLKNWQELRDVLLIYACVFLSYKKFEKGGNEE